MINKIDIIFEFRFKFLDSGQTQIWACPIYILSTSNPNQSLHSIINTGYDNNYNVFHKNRNLLMLISFSCTIIYFIWKMKIIVCLRQLFSKKEIFLATPDDYSWGQGTVMMARCAATLNWLVAALVVESMKILKSHLKNYIAKTSPWAVSFFT